MSAHAPQLNFTTTLADAALSTPTTFRDSTYGALFMGAAFGLMNYLTMHQTYRYFRLFPTDVRLLVRLVIAIFLLDTFHTVLIIFASYYHIITNFTNPEAMVQGQWAARLLTPTVGIMFVLCQSFYARRVWLIGRNHRYLVYIAVVFMVVFLGFTAVATAEGFTMGLQVSDFSHVRWLISAMFGVALVVDVLLAGTLIVVLSRGRTGFKQTDSIIEVVIKYTINTGLLISITGFLGFIFGFVLRGDFIYIGLSTVGAKFYTNSVLMVLNSRRRLSRMATPLETTRSNTLEFRTIHRNPQAHTIIESWDVPQVSVLPQNSTHISFEIAPPSGSSAPSVTLQRLAEGSKNTMESKPGVEGSEDEQHELKLV